MPHLPADLFRAIPGLGGLQVSLRTVVANPGPASYATMHGAAGLGGGQGGSGCGCGVAETRAIVAVDGTDRLLEGVGGRELDDVLSSCAPTPGSSVRILFGGDADLLNRCCADAWTRARAGRTGLLLRVDPDLHGALLHADLPRRDELAPRPGRGWCVGPDGADPLQVFLPPDHHPAA